MELLRRVDVVDQLGGISCPTLLCVGEVDSVTPVAASREIIDGLLDGLGELAVVDGAGHFPWLDRADSYWPLLTDFVTRTAT